MDIQRVKNVLVAINLLVIIALYIHKKKEKFKKKILGLAQMLLQRKEKGHFHIFFFQFMKNNDNEQFFKFTRMTVCYTIRKTIKISTRLLQTKKKSSQTFVTRTSIMYNFVVSIFVIRSIFYIFELYYHTNILFCSYLAHG